MCVTVIMVHGGSTQRRGLKKSMKAEAGKHAEGQWAVRLVGMTVLKTAREILQYNLNKKSAEDERTDLPAGPVFCMVSMGEDLGK